LYLDNLGMRFSQRIGKTTVKTELEREGMSEGLRNNLWNVTLNLVLDSKDNSSAVSYNPDRTELHLFMIDLYMRFLKWPIDTIPMSTYLHGIVSRDDSVKTIRGWFFAVKWFDLLDFIEFVSRNNPKFKKEANTYFKEEMSAYRFVDGVLAEINSQEEVVEVEAALHNTDKFVSVRTHLQTALSLLSDRKTPDFRNSIKESISAVESLAKIITQNEKTTLGQALKEIEKTHQIPRALQGAFDKLYGYTSDQSGIRHALLENSVPVNMEEARFMLVTCSAFVNYLISKL